MQVFFECDIGTFTLIRADVAKEKANVAKKVTALHLSLADSTGNICFADDPTVLLSDENSTCSCALMHRKLYIIGVFSRTTQ